MGDVPNSPRAMPRRPLRSRDTRLAAAVASRLAGMGIRPNTISVLSLGCAAAAGASILATRWAGPVGAPALLLVGALFIQLRLLCNLLDGMVAVEGGLGTKSGEIFNDLPDRLADLLILVPAGYAAPTVPPGTVLGWAAGALAVLTAYVRVLAGSAGAPQRFLGPMAKQHRMALMTAASILAAGLHPFGVHQHVLAAALAATALGCAITVIRRAVAAVRDLEAG